MAKSSQDGDGRVVIALKMSGDVDPAIAAATLLAEATRGELIGLFVEDDSLINLADLPFTRAIKYGERIPRQFTRDTMIAAFARAAAACRQALSTEAAKAKVRWSFVTERGEFSSKLQGVVLAGDFLVISGEAQGFGAGQLLKELRSSPAGLRGVLVSVLQRSRPRKGPVIAIDDGDEKGEQTIKLASQIAMVTGNDLMIFVVADNDASATQIIERARRIANPSQSISTYRFPPGTPQSIAAATSEFDASFVVADQQGEPFVDDKAALALFRAARAPVLLLQ